MGVRPTGFACKLKISMFLTRKRKKCLKQNDCLAFYGPLAVVVVVVVTRIT